MHLFTTILFINGNPVRYEVVLSGQRFLLEPTDNPNDFIVPPVIEAWQKGGRWEVSGTTDQDLVAQVVEDMNLNSNHLPALN